MSTTIHLVADLRCRPITRITSPGGADVPGRGYRLLLQAMNAIPATRRAMALLHYGLDRSLSS